MVFHEQNTKRFYGNGGVLLRVAQVLDGNARRVQSRFQLRHHLRKERRECATGAKKKDGERIPYFQQNDVSYTSFK
jgi:hypothetical protein